MKAQSKRKIKHGLEFNHLFPPADSKDTTLMGSGATIDDTMFELRGIIYQTLDQTKGIAQVLKGKTLEETCKNIWNWVYNHIQYVEDEKFIEQLREPARCWADRKGDCDCYTILISSILLNLKIPHILRITKYKKRWPEQPYWQHIYPIVPRKGDLSKEYELKRNRNSYIVIDCVPDYYDYEVEYLEKRDYNMELARLSGLSGEDIQPVIVKERISANGIKLGIDAQENVYIESTPGGDFTKRIWVPYNPEIMAGLGLFASKAKRQEKKEWRQEKREIKKSGGSKSDVKAKLKEHKLDKPRTKAGEAIRKVASKVNKVNPATVLLRNGILAAMKVDLMGVARKMRFGFLSEAEAKKRGVDMKEWKKLKTTLELRMRQFEQMGGKRDSFKNAILKGKGNKKDPVLGGLGSLGIYTEDGIYEVSGFDEVFLGLVAEEMGMEGLGSLGVEPATASAIAAATASISAWAVDMKKNIKELFPGGLTNPLNKETEGAPTAEEDAANFNAEIQQVEPEAVPIAPKQIVAIQQGVESKRVSPNALAQEATGEDINTTSGETDWKTPALIGLGIAAVGTTIYLATRKSNTPKPALSGVKKSSKGKKKKGTKKGKKISVINL